MSKEPNETEETVDALQKLDEEAHASQLGIFEVAVRKQVASSLSTQLGFIPVTKADLSERLHKVADELAPATAPWSPKFGPWNVEISPEGQYLYIDHDEHPGEIHIKADVDGFVLDVWNDDKLNPQVGLGMAIEYAELAAEPLETPAPGAPATPPKLPNYLVVEVASAGSEDIESLANDLGSILDRAQVEGAVVHGPFNEEIGESLQQLLNK